MMENIDGINTTTLASLTKQLTGAGIVVSEWGKGKAKTLEHLRKEIDEGETELFVEPDGTLVRKVMFGACQIFYTDAQGKRYQLFEEKQIFNDGRERRRRRNDGVSEKMKKGEDITHAMERGLQEELGLENGVAIEKIRTAERRDESESYPGLITLYEEHYFEAELSDVQYKPEGYIETQEDKRTFFVWKEVA